MNNSITKKTNPRIIAFYLPQYHCIPENDKWWGKGFTEWTNVKKAKPNFEDHYQPHVPSFLGYYDLSELEVQERQAELAKQYGIFGFCYHHYWFNGKRLLKKPLENILKSKKPDLPFCVSWANENWTRTWDGLEKHILMKQTHTENSDNIFIDHLLPVFLDKRYIRVNNKPLLLVYRVDLLAEPKRTAENWRNKCIKAGLDGVYLCAVDFYGIESPNKYGFDALVEFPPHRLYSEKMLLNSSLKIHNSKFQGHCFDMEKLIYSAISKPIPEFTYLRGLMPSWDNTARRQNTSTIFLNADPHNFEFWLSEIVKQTMKNRSGDERLVFINAWNEWGEGCHLEPDYVNGFKYLEAIQNVMGGISSTELLIKKLKHEEFKNNTDEGQMLLRIFSSRERSLSVLIHELNSIKYNAVNLDYKDKLIKLKQKIKNYGNTILLKIKKPLRSNTLKYFKSFLRKIIK